MIESRDNYLTSAKVDDKPLKEGAKLELAQLALEVSFDKTAKNFNFQKAEVAKSIEKTLKWQKDFLK